MKTLNLSPKVCKLRLESKNMSNFKDNNPDKSNQELLNRVMPAYSFNFSYNRHLNIASLCFLRNRSS